MPNPFKLLDDTPDETEAAPAAPVKSTPKPAAKSAAKTTSKPAGRRDGPARTASAGDPSFERDNRGGAARSNRRGRGGGRSDRKATNSRAHDVEKRHGAGAGNWGSTKDAVKAATEGAEAEEKVDETEQVEVEEEEPDNTMTLEDYMAQSSGSSLAAQPKRQANDGDTSKFGRKHERAPLEDSSDDSKTGRAREQRSSRKVAVEAGFRVVQDADQAQRGRGRGRGGRGRGEGRGRGGRGEGRGRGGRGEGRGRGGRGEGRGRGGRGEGRGRGGRGRGAGKTPDVTSNDEFPSL